MPRSPSPLTPAPGSYAILPGTLIFLLLLFLLVFTSSPASARELTVDGNGSAGFTTIQDAVNASQPGDVIRIGNGTYREQVVVNRSITIRGENTSTCIIHAGGGGFALLVENATVEVTGLTFTGSGCCDGAGLKVRNATVNLSDVRSMDNLMSGIHVFDSRVRVRNALIHNNSMGMVWVSTLEPQMEGSLFLDNGVGLSLFGCRDAVIGSSHFLNNTFGMGIDSSMNTVVENCSFTGGNHGLMISRSEETRIEHCVMEGALRGISVIELSANTTVTRSTIRGNREYGIHATVGVMATDNWWGNETGPHHWFLHPGGTGDRITTGVEFYPWNGTLFLEPRLLVASSPPGRDVWGEILFEGTAEDPDDSPGPLSVEVSLDDGPWMTVEGAERWQFVWNTSLVEDGNRTLSFRAFDGEYHSAEVRMTFRVANREDDPGNGAGDGTGNGSLDPDGSDDEGYQRTLVLVLAVLMIPVGFLAAILAHGVRKKP